MRRSTVICLAIISILITLQYSLSSAGSSLVIATGSKTGTYYRFGQDIANVCEKNGLGVTVRTSNGSLDNIYLMKNKSVDIAIVQSDVISKLYRSQPDIADHIRVVFPLYMEEIHVLARKDINSIKDLRRKKIATGSKDSGTYMTLSTILYKNLIGKVDEHTALSPPEAMLSVLSGQIDAMIYVAGKPVELFKKMEKMARSPEYTGLIKRVHFMPLKYGEIYQDYYVASVIGPGDYSWIEKATPTIAVRAFLVTYYDSPNITPEDCDPRLSKLVSIIRNNFERLKREGHEKWKSVDLNAKVDRPWRADPSSACHGVDMEELRKLLE